MFSKILNQLILLKAQQNDVYTLKFNLLNDLFDYYSSIFNIITVVNQRLITSSSYN